MRLTRTQLRRMIIKEVRMMQEGANELTQMIAAATAGSPMGPAMNAMISGLVAGNALDGEAQKLYDSLPEEIQIALDGLVIAIKALPGKAKESVIKKCVEAINSVTDAISEGY